MSEQKPRNRSIFISFSFFRFITFVVTVVSWNRKVKKRKQNIFSVAGRFSLIWIPLVFRFVCHRHFYASLFALPCPLAIFRSFVRLIISLSDRKKQGKSKWSREEEKKELKKKTENDINRNRTRNTEHDDDGDQKWMTEMERTLECVNECTRTQHLLSFAQFSTVALWWLAKFQYFWFIWCSVRDPKKEQEKSESPIWTEQISPMKDSLFSISQLEISRQ